jgi:hypothetical protein
MVRKGMRFGKIDQNHQGKPNTKEMGERRANQASIAKEEDAENTMSRIDPDKPGEKSKAR